MHIQLQEYAQHVEKFRILGIIAFISLKYAIYGVTKPSVWCNQSFGLFKTNALFGINQPSVPFKGTETGFLESRIRAGLSFFSVGL